MKIHKYHRNILIQEIKYLDTLKAKIEGYVKKMQAEKISIENEEVMEKLKITKKEKLIIEKVDKACT